MLRITRIPTDEQRTTILKFEGKLLAPWTDEVRSAVDKARRGDGHAPVRLDLSPLTFVDAAGASLLRQLIADGLVTVVACSSFLAELLHLEVRP